MKAKGPPLKFDLHGKRFGRLLVLEYRRSERRWEWLCRCDCGGTKLILSCNLRNGSSRSCGCLQREDLSKRQTTHGKTLTKEYRAWRGMLGRCFVKTNKDYPRYGGRGIRVCQKWRHSFEMFLQDVGKAPTPNHSIDRYPDNNGDYRPGNVRWATVSQQARNRRTNTRITFNGRTMNIGEWERHLGFPRLLLTNRLRGGWSIEKALTTKVQKCRRC